MVCLSVVEEKKYFVSSQVQTPLIGLGEEEEGGGGEGDSSLSPKESDLETREGETEGDGANRKKRQTDDRYFGRRKEKNAKPQWRISAVGL